MPTNYNHPECREDEVFFINTQRKFSELQAEYHNKVLRAGKISYSQDGSLISKFRPKYYPVFAKKEGK